MLKKRRKVVGVLRSKKRFSLLTKITFSLIGVTILIGGYLYATMQKTSINLITGGSDLPSSCRTVSSLTYSGSCSDGSYESITYTCGASTISNSQGGPSTCKSFTDWYLDAKEKCAAACPSPTPQVTPTDRLGFLYSPSEPGLRYYWPMDETGNDRCSDGSSDVCEVSGYFNGSVVGTQIVAGISNNARSFNGRSDYINLPATTSHSGSFTYEAWINLSSDVKADKVILCEGNASDGCYQKFFVSSANGKLAASVDSNGTNHYSDYPLTVNVWTHVAMSYEGNKPTKLTLYVNGIRQQDTGSETMHVAGSSIRIGARTTSTPALFFEGSIDEPRIYSPALSEALILQHYRQPSYPSGGDSGTGEPIPTATAVPNN